MGRLKKYYIHTTTGEISTDNNDGYVTAGMRYAKRVSKMVKERKPGIARVANEGLAKFYRTRAR